MIAELLLHESEAETEPDWIICEKCSGSGFIEYDVDYFGRKQEWRKCNACEDGMVEVQL